MKIGIAGNGAIIPVFIEGARRAGMEITEICGRPQSMEKLQKLADDYQIPVIRTDYAVMLASENVEAVYIGVSNYMHYSYAKQALEAGRHVICEKPFTSNYAQAKVLYDFAVEKHLYLFEAVMNQYNPLYGKVREALSEIGELRMAELSFSQYSRRYDAFKAGEILPVFDPDKAGGALMDINLYNIYFMVGLFGKPDRIRYQANIVRNIDTSGILTMEYENFRASLIGAKDCSAPCRVSFHGDRGYLFSEDAASRMTGFILHRNDGSEERFVPQDHVPGIYYEMKEFLRMHDTGAWEEMKQHLDVSLTVMQILDEARNQAGIRTDFEV
ncbi:MAG: Gfo/Idh/MocA family oxidoreductase [Solobacterium sp.]|nr:Gfo/Idh/MocA family oxidoreductase [Solobacterium sp.]